MDLWQYLGRWVYFTTQNWGLIGYVIPSYRCYSEEVSMNRSLSE